MEQEIASSESRHIGVRVPKDLYWKLKELASKNEQTVSEYLRAIVVDMLNKEQ